VAIFGDDCKKNPFTRILRAEQIQEMLATMLFRVLSLFAI
jgi:hypothetical protein